MQLALEWYADWNEQNVYIEWYFAPTLPATRKLILIHSKLCEIWMHFGNNGIMDLKSYLNSSHGLFLVQIVLCIEQC